jgi:hypothetical protein
MVSCTLRPLYHQKNARCVVSRARVKVWQRCTVYVALLRVSGMLMTHYVVSRELKYSTVGRQLKKEGNKQQ